jgi:superoxide reductase
MELLTSNRDDRDDDEQNVLLHWPLITKDAESREIRVKVSTLRHPMDPVHYIQWMLCIQGNHSEFRRFKPGENCDTTFALLDPRENAAVYVYCNHHGLWAAITGIEKMPRALAGG